ncbi:tripartite tricarboxylate transporter substrate binding protein [Ramlibacter sp. RBP-2]|uniref:Tripartite tricarboxylate transporter substrate binding protein n=1 Tax=Ramlibacter lithotrophicus TaxID=2606681 RepID=A0A7X6DKK5_9BURK|nr:tripartite tricarboxylate transporter substrate binding protein [Ramlibacter lithotrophicus]NKE68870.1 tripartite tricarboxylate transporter substrate binding protein [Ramlibacter lithotrophicus]
MRNTFDPGYYSRRRFLCRIAAGAAAAVPAMAMAQSWPARPVRVLVGSNAGSPIDVPTRSVMQRLSARFGQQFVIENKAGAGGVLAANAVAKAAPDGYTLLSSGPAEIINNYFIWQNSGQPFPFDPARDLAPVALLQRGPGVLVVSPKLNIATWQELVQFLRTQPDKGSIGVTQLGATTHLASELLKRESGLNLTIVPYRGSVDMHADLREARLTMALTTPFETIEFVRRGELRPLAVSHTRRIEGFEQTPTFGELGLPRVVNLPALVLSAPAATPADIVQQLNRGVTEIIAANPGLVPFGREAPPMTPAQLSAYLAEERERWGRVIREVNIRI